MVPDGDVLPVARLELRGKDPEREGDELARFLPRVFAEQLLRPHPFGGRLEQLGDGGKVGGGRMPHAFWRVGRRFALAHWPAPGCSAPCVRFCNASAWKYVRQATMTSSMSPSITAARLSRASTVGSSRTPSWGTFDAGSV